MDMGPIMPDPAGDKSGHRSPELNTARQRLSESG
jgi:hypothetical protein